MRGWQGLLSHRRSRPSPWRCQTMTTYLVLPCTTVHSALSTPRPAVRRVLLLLYSIVSQPAADSTILGTRFVLAPSRDLQRVASCYRPSGSVCVCGGENPTRPAKILPGHRLIRPFVAGPVHFQIARIKLGILPPPLALPEISPANRSGNYPFRSERGP